MLTKRIIPCLDCKNGNVVKGVKFQNLMDVGSPSELALRYEQEGADEIVLLDVVATVQDRYFQIETIRKVREVLSIPLTVGGGIKNIQDIDSLLQAGADKVSINSAAVKNPELISEASTRFGSQCIVVAIDAKNIGNAWSVLTQSGTKDESLDVCEWVKMISALGAGEILLTSFDRDGTKNGYDLALIRAASSATTLPVIASGGARNAEDLNLALQSGADAVLAASMFHFKEYTIQQVKRELKNFGIEVRL